MRDSDALDNNPLVSRSALEAIHSQALARPFPDVTLTTRLRRI